MESEALKSGILESSMDAILTMDHAGLVREFNPGAERLFGCTRAQAVGRLLAELIVPPESRAAHEAGLARYVATGETRIVGKRIEVTAQRVDGTRFDAELTLVRVAGSEPPLFAGTVRDITSRKETEAQIRRANESLEERVAARTAELQSALNEMESFSYSISHDLRTPLRAMNGYAQLLMRDQGLALGAEARGMLERIAVNADSMARLIDGLLDFARLGRTELISNRVDMDALARAAAEELRAASKDWSRATLTIGALPVARGDGEMLKQVWVNLLSNAFKFSANVDAPAVVVGARQAAGEWIYEVRDNGAGFDSAHADRLFGVFQRLHAAGAFPGIGIGLAHARRIVERHGGRIWAHSTPGAGATFSFSLPASADPAPTSG